MSTRLQENDHPGTFEHAEMENLRVGMRMSFYDKLEWLEDAAELGKRFRESLFRKGKPAIGLNGEVVWSEEEYWGYPKKKD